MFQNPVVQQFIELVRDQPKKFQKKLFHFIKKLNPSCLPERFEDISIENERICHETVQMKFKGINVFL
jgi:hypothetical protein